MEEMIQLFQDDPGPIIAITAIAGGIALGVLSMISSAIVQVSKANTRERTRREIAAYVAEGTIAPDVAERMMESGRKPGGKKESCWWT